MRDRDRNIVREGERDINIVKEGVIEREIETETEKYCEVGRE